MEDLKQRDWIGRNFLNLSFPQKANRSVFGWTAATIKISKHRTNLGDLSRPQTTKISLVGKSLFFKGLFYPACLARVVYLFAFVAANFMGHENGDKQRQAKR